MHPFFRSIFMALAFATVGACGERKDDADQPVPVTVVAQPPRMLPERTRIEAIGTARATVSAELYPEAAGVVTRVRFTAGQRVAKGAPLVELDARRERLAVDLADVAVREAAQLLGRYRRIEDTGALSASQIEAGVTALDSAKIELSQAKVALADRTVRAPFTGYMGLPQIDQGDRITPQSLIGQIDDRSSLFVDFEAPETAFEQLKPGSVVALKTLCRSDAHDRGTGPGDREWRLARSPQLHRAQRRAEQGRCAAPRYELQRRFRHARPHAARAPRSGGGMGRRRIVPVGSFARASPDACR